jgi:hypothetical protein
MVKILRVIISKNMEVNSMALLLIILALVLLMAILLFTVNSRINLIFDSDSKDMHVTLSWLSPFLRSEIKRVDSGLIMTVFFFNKRVLTREISKEQNKNGSRSAIWSLNPTDIHVNTRYGFRDPFVTGLVGSAIVLASEFFKVESLHQRPDFLAASDYINLDATAKLNLGHSLLKLI